VSVTLRPADAADLGFMVCLVNDDSDGRWNDAVLFSLLREDLADAQ
jgi:hypothetical protein